MKKNLPIDRYRHQSEDASAYREDRDELGNFAVERAERPVTVEHVSVVEDDVQGGDHGVRDAEVHQEIIGDGAHSSVRQHDPYHYQIAAGRHGDHASEQKRPNHLSPPWQHKLISRLETRIVAVVVIAVIVVPNVVRR